MEIPHLSQNLEISEMERDTENAKNCHLFISKITMLSQMFLFLLGNTFKRETLGNK